MQVDIAETPPGGVEADVLVFPVADPVALSAAAKDLDEAVGGQLSHLVEDGELKGSRGCVTVLHTVDRIGSHRVAATGLGPTDEIDADSFRTAAANAARQAGKVGARTLAWILEENVLPLSPEEQGRAVVDGVALGPYDAGRWKTDGEDVPAIERLVLCGPGAAPAAEEAHRTAVVAGWTNRCRDLVNAPPNELDPSTLAEFAEELADRFEAVTLETLGPKEIEQAGMGAFHAVARGSDVEPRLITARYEPPEPAQADFLLGLVGKAITFDSGGFSLKPADKMDDMKSDMGGGGAVLAALGAIAELELPVRIVAVVAACENLIGGHAYRPGDIVTAMNGKTIEITNTDAEGRLVLADALWHARQAGATHLLDLATLTGGVVIAMGDFYAGLFGNDDEWVETIRQAAETSGDHAWRLPVHPSYRRYIDSTFADMKNSSTLRQGTPLYAANFLSEFVGEGPWAHLDIAGTAFLERGREDYYTALGATGYGVRLLAALASRVCAAGG